MPNKVIGMMLQLANNIQKSYGIDIKNSSVDKVNEKNLYTKEDYQSKVSELIKLDTSRQLTPQQKNDKIKELENISKQIQWS